MIAETRLCKKCNREIPLRDIENGHEQHCKGLVGEDSEGQIFESSVKDDESVPNDIPYMFKTRSQRQQEGKGEYPKGQKEYAIESPQKDYQHRIDECSKDKDVRSSPNPRPSSVQNVQRR